jgi:hypothetical protein
VVPGKEGRLEANPVKPGAEPGAPSPGVAPPAPGTEEAGDITGRIGVLERADTRPWAAEDMAEPWEGSWPGVAVGGIAYGKFTGIRPPENREGLAPREEERRFPEPGIPAADPSEPAEASFR